MVCPETHIPAPFQTTSGSPSLDCSAPADTVESAPPGGAHKVSSFLSNEKFAVLTLQKAKWIQVSRIARFTADFTFSLGCEASHNVMNGGCAVCSNLGNWHCARLLPPKATECWFIHRSGQTPCKEVLPVTCPQFPIAFLLTTHPLTHKEHLQVDPFTCTLL